MLVNRRYDRGRAVTYARRWAFDRSPLFESFNGIGGDCTNFVSQCVYAGSCVMNYTRDFGWYYVSSTDRAAAWSGVEFFYTFMTENEGAGPYMSEVDENELDFGDVIQLGRADGDYFHTLIVVGRIRGEYLVAAHSNDVYGRPLSAYDFERVRYLHVDGVRADIQTDCFDELIRGERI